jgi:hypothetical protein
MVASTDGPAHRPIRPLRARAEELRTRAEEIQNPVTRDTMLRTARAYDMLADFDEGAARQFAREDAA